MGKIIAKNIKGMGWMTKISLIAVLTLVFSVFIYQYLQKTRDVQAAVALHPTAVWSNIHAAAPGTALAANTTVNTTSTGSYTAGTGASRLLLVAVYYELGTASTATFTVTYGGTTVTQAATSGGVSGRQHVWVGYIKDATIPAAASTVVSGIRCATASTLTSISIKVATYVGVDQATPTSGTNGNATATATAATNAVVNYVIGGKTIAAMANGGAGATIAVTANPTLTANAAAANTTNHTTSIYESAAHTAASSYASGGISVTYSGTTSARSAIAVAALRPATTNLGNGVVGTNANVAPGAANQKIDGFAFNTTTAGSTDSITGLTVTTTNQAAIASLSIWNEAGTTQYFTTVNNPGSNTWAFSGGTPIPVTNTAANFKILATYKTRAAGAPAGTTTTTANVTAFTGTNLQTGTDTADTTLSLMNNHLASTWGTCTPGSSQIALNWTYGTPGQSVVIIRYQGANSDTTKPVDATAYTTGTGFGTGGTVRYVGAASTFTDTVGLTNGQTYYYKIFEYETVGGSNYYYNATDVWTTGLIPINPDGIAPTVDAGFAATSPVNTLSVPITYLSATDNGGGSGVNGYLITTSATAPSAVDPGWTSTPPASYSVASQGTYTLYPWARDLAGNVSAVYGSPVTVVVDTTKPTVTAFTIPASSASRTIAITTFTASDTGGSNLAGYLITTSSTPPTAGDPGWNSVAPTTYVVGADGNYTLYPWIKDNAGNVSLVFGTPRTIFVDAGPPTGLSLISPADEAVGLPQATTLTCSTATDVSGPVQYYFSVTSDTGYSNNSGWISATSYAPPSLVKGDRYLWQVKARDALGNETVFTTPRTFTITAPCVRNDPTITLLTAGGGIASTIVTDSGTATYNVRLYNNDTGDCGSNTFNLTAVDTDLMSKFDNSYFDNGLMTKSITLQPNSNTLTTLTTKATAGEDSGVERSIIQVAADANHAYTESGFVQTTLNVVTCVPKTPLLIVGPDSGYLNPAGKMVYTITVKNTDTGAGCTPVNYTLTRNSDSNNTDFNASQFSTSSLTLASGELGSATLTVSAKSTAAKLAQNLTNIGLSATGHTSPANVVVTSTVNNPMLHNSFNTGSPKWTVSGGWGIPNGRYGEIDCSTCHMQAGGDTPNIKRVTEKIFTPYTTGAAPRFPGHNKAIEYRRYVGDTAIKPVLGWDSTATPRTTSKKVCEACHTYDATGTNGVKAHPYSTSGATLGNHFNTDGTDCTRCHKHSQGFGASNMLCNTCHGNSAVTTITADNRYVVAPPTNASGNAGSLTGVGQVSNDPKVGAHQTHLQLFNGFTNYSTVDFRCQSCHGALPSGPTWATHANSTSAPVFQGMANNRNAMSPTWIAASLTCSNTYCHNPSGTGGTLNSANVGLRPFVSWTASSYLSQASTKTQTNCNRCHKVPEDAGFSSTFGHGSMATSTDCSGCHGHNGETSGVFGQRHMDGKKYGAGSCDSCHGYQVGSWAAKAERTSTTEGKSTTAHEKHISYLLARYNTFVPAGLNPNGDQFASGNSWTYVCGVCHDTSTHNMNEAIPGTGRTISIKTEYKFGGVNPTYNGTVGQSSSVKSKVCLNTSCHYFTSPVWSTY